MIPIEQAGGFVADGTGGGTEKKVIQHGHWCAVYASCQCAGSGQWVVGKPGRAMYFQQGANVVLGPVILRPGEQMEVTVAGATAGAQASIVYTGWQGDAEDGSDLGQVVPSIESAGSLAGGVPISISGGTIGITGNVPVKNATGTQLATNQPQTLLATALNKAANTQFTQTLTLDPGCHVLGIGVAPHAGGTGATLNNIQTHNLAFPVQFFVQSAAVPLGQGFWLFPVSPVIDSANQIDVVLTPGSNITDFYFVEVLDVEAVGIGGYTPGVAGGTGYLPPNEAPTFCQAIDTALAGSATVQILSAPGNAWERLYIHDIKYMFDVVANTTGIWKGHTTNDLVHEQWNADTGANSTGSSGWDRWWPLGGVALNPGDSLDLVNQLATAGPHLRGMVTYSIGI